MVAAAVVLDGPGGPRRIGRGRHAGLGRHLLVRSRAAPARRRRAGMGVADGRAHPRQGVPGVMSGIFFPKVANYREVWSTITAMTAIELATLVAVAMWNLASYWPMLTAVQPGLRLREAAVGNLASTAVANTIPGGGALGIGVTMSM